MHTAVIYFYNDKHDELLKLSRGIARGIEAQGHHVDIIDGNKDMDKRLFIYKYIVIGVETISAFGGKQPEKVEEFFKSAANISGKRSCAFVNKSILGSEKTLSKLMKGMEIQGMMITYSEVIKDDIAAEGLGKMLNIVRK